LLLPFGVGSPVLAMSAMDAAFQALIGSATVTNTGITYSTDPTLNLVDGVEPERPAFVYKASFSVSGIAYTGQVLALEDEDGLSTSDYDYNDDFFEIGVARDYSKPIANPDSYKDGVGGELIVNAEKGLLANDSSQDSGTLAVYSVNGSLENSVNDGKGTLEWNSDGSFTYTPNYGFFGTDTFTYDDSDTVTSDDSESTTYSDKTTITFQVLLPEIYLENVGTDPILVSDDSTNPTANADSDHLADIQIKIDRDSVFESLPYDLSGWKLNLDAVDADGSVEFWDSLGKTTQLNSDGVGDQSWEFGTSISSGGVPSDVYADANDPGTYTLEAQFVAPSGASDPPTPPKYDVEVNALDGELAAETINTTNTGFNGDPFDNITGFLPHGQQAYVPLSNESQVYNLEDTNGDLTQDRDYYGAIPNDKFLLPVELDGTPGSTYLLVSPGDGISVWRTADRTGLVYAATPIVLDASGTATFYVEGDQDGQSTLNLKQAGQILDSLTINVFSFTGPQDVPDFSVYSYGIVGLPATAAASWQVNYSGQLRSSTQSSASIGWQFGGINAFGQASYAVNDNYTWSYYVNIVQITVTEAPVGSSFPPQPDSGSFQTHFPTAPAGPNKATSVFIDSNAFGNSESEVSVAAVTLVGPNGFMVEGPLGNAVQNPNGNWGVDQMVVGFTQLLLSSSLIGFYQGGGILESLVDLSTPLLDASSSGTAWVLHNSASIPSQLVQNRPDAVGSIPLTISVYDKPAIAFPAYFDQSSAAVGQYPITAASISENFVLNVSAGTKDSSQQSGNSAVLGNVYTIVAQHSWNWTGSGVFNGALQYTADSGDGVNSLTNWVTPSAGYYFVNPYLKKANQVGSKDVWIPLIV
jgi:hypothetical protein